jgi:hypothetical protein
MHSFPSVDKDKQKKYFVFHALSDLGINEKNP